MRPTPHRERHTRVAAPGVEMPSASSHRRMAWATAGLVAAWVLLTVFSVTVAVSNSRASGDAHRGAVVSEQFELVHEALLAQENAADAVVADGAEELPAYREAEAVTRAGLADLRGMTDDPTEAATWLGMHAGYGQAVLGLFRVGESAPDRAEAYETSDVDPIYDPLEAVLRDEARQHHEQAYGALVSLGRSQQVLVLVTPVVFGAGLLVLLAATAALRRSRREVAAVAEENGRQALHDPLTGLPNRVLLGERSRQALDALVTPGAASVALMLLDLNGFKQINDRFGHHSGDLVLQAVAERLRSAVRPTDTVARLGGDEFAVLLPAVGGRADAMMIAHTLQAALVPPIAVDGLLLTIGASLGVALSGEGGDSLEALLRSADTAMYQAKDGRPGNTLVNGPSTGVAAGSSELTGPPALVPSSPPQAS